MAGTKPAAAPKAAIKWPSIEEILVAKGLTVEEAQRLVEQFAAKFPYAEGAPEAAAREFLSGIFDSGHVLGVLMDSYRAFEKMKRAGWKGPVAHAGAELA